MKPFHLLFGDEKQIEYKGKQINKYYELLNPGQYTIQFTFKEINSMINQAIVLYLLDFSGDFYVDGKKQIIPPKRFPGFSFWFGTSPSEFEVSIKLDKGKVLICNGSDLTGTKQFCRSMHMGCAIYIEEIRENKYRFNCNDHEIDDDFDDLIYEMEIVQFIPQ